MNFKKVDLGYVIRTAVCVLAFLAAAAYFFHVCSGVADNYLLFAGFTAHTAILWFVNFAVSAALFIITLGVTAALVRPTWVAMVTYVIAAGLYIFFVGSGLVTLVAAGISVAILVSYLIAEVHLFGNQIKASTHPLGEKKMLVCTLLAALISVSIAVGYMSDSVKRSYVLPPEAKTAYSQYMMNLAKPQIDAQKGTAKQKETALKTAEKNINDLAIKAEETIKPVQKYIPAVLGFFAFCAFQMVLIFVGIFAMLFVPLLFWILKITHFTHIATEKCEVTRLTLKSN